MTIKSLIISDMHLGAKACNSILILEVLNYFNYDNLILNGDIIDFWQISYKPHWTKKHSDIIRLICNKARNGVNVIYTIGNHDEILRDYEPISMDNIHIKNTYLYDSVSQRKILFIHGDAFDFIIRSNKFLAKIGTVAYDSLITINHYLNVVRRFFSLKYWSLSKYLKEQTKKKVGILKRFDKLIVEYAKKQNVSVICAGHIHIPEELTIDGVLYLNSGDMCETGSFIIEHLDGRLELVKNFELFKK